MVLLSLWGASIREVLQDEEDTVVHRQSRKLFRAFRINFNLAVRVSPFSDKVEACFQKMQLDVEVSPPASAIHHHRCIW